MNFNGLSYHSIELYVSMRTNYGFKFIYLTDQVTLPPEPHDIVIHDEQKSAVDL